MSYKLWSSQQAIPVLKAGMCIQYEESPYSYMLLDNNQMVELSTLDSVHHFQTYDWPNKFARLASIWSCPDHYYKDKFKI
jgi:hypothetical protein